MWWKLKEDNPKIKSKETVLGKVRPAKTVQEWWEQSSTTILRVGHEVLSITAQQGGDPQEIMGQGGGMIRCRR